MALAEDKFGNIIQAERIDGQQVHQTVSIGATSVQSAAFNASTKSVRLYASVGCYIDAGTNPTATSSKIYLPAGSVEYFGVIPGHKIAVLQETTGGTLRITEFK